MLIFSKLPQRALSSTCRIEEFLTQIKTPKIYFLSPFKCGDEEEEKRVNDSNFDDNNEFSKKNRSCLNIVMSAAHESMWEPKMFTFYFWRLKILVLLIWSLAREIRELPMVINKIPQANSENYERLWFFEHFSHKL